MWGAVPGATFRVYQWLGTAGAKRAVAVTNGTTATVTRRAHGLVFWTLGITVGGVETHDDTVSVSSWLP